MNKVVLVTRKYKVGYEVREELSDVAFKVELLSGESDGDTNDLIRHLNTETTVLVKSAYTPEGDYIGNKKTAHFLCSKKGITPEKMYPHSKVCSIGWCQAEQRWYGWSHRAIFGFGIGDTVKKGDCTNSSGYTDEYLRTHPDEDTSLPVGFTARDFADCKKMAIAFAESVG